MSLLPNVTFTYPGLAHLILRVSVGWIFIFHGSQKLFGAFGGHGVGGFAKWLSSIQVPFSEVSAWLASGAEFFCGLALVFGIYARWATLPLIVVMLVAIIYVHGVNGFDIAQKGFEYNFVLIAALLTIFLQGPSKWSVRS